MTRFSLRSFVAGVCCASVFMIWIERTMPQVQANQARGFATAGGEPIVPPLQTKVEDMVIGGFASQPLDGINCIRCTLQAEEITYAGGSFRCEGCNVQAKHVQLKGAALNTLNALQFFGLIPSPKPLPVVPKDPIKRVMFEIHPQENVKWVSDESTK